MSSRTSVKLSPLLKQQSHKAVQDGGFGARGKSRWLNDALHRFFEGDPGLVTVGVGEDLESLSDTDSYLIDDANMSKIDNAVSVLITQDPRMTGVKSQIIRAAIRMNLDEHK